jgi:HlyD family secretion protein
VIFPGGAKKFASQAASRSITRTPRARAQAQSNVAAARAALDAATAQRDRLQAEVTRAQKELRAGLRVGWSRARVVGVTTDRDAEIRAGLAAGDRV